MHWLKRLLFGWRLPITIRGRRLAVPIIATLLLLCCGGTFTASLIDSSLRQAGVLPTITPTPTRTPRPTAIPRPTRTPRPTATVAPSKTPRPTATAQPTTAPLQVMAIALPTAAPAAATPTTAPTPTATTQPTDAPTIVNPSAARNANLRQGPGTGYQLAGSVTTGQPLVIAARNPAGDWLQLATGAWISAALVSNPPAALPVASNIPALPTPTPAQPTSAPQPVVAAAGSVRIIGLLRDGQAGQKEPDEYVEIRNTGTGPQDLTGWRLVSQRGAEDGQIYYFPQGFTMQPGQTCRIYTAEIHPETCGLSFNYTRTAVWNNSGSDPALLYDAAGNLVSRWD